MQLQAIFTLKLYVFLCRGMVCAASRLTVVFMITVPFGYGGGLKVDVYRMSLPSSGYLLSHETDQCHLTKKNIFVLQLNRLVDLI